MTSERTRVYVVVAAVALLAVAPLFFRRSPRAPYVVTAIDYHFHDAHPTLPIAPGRDFVVVNDGVNVHNVTIPGTSYSHDIRPGGQLVIRNIAAFLGGPGEYPFYCRFHQNLGMAGVIVIAK